MNKKLIFLFIALLLPGLIYTFLKMFGSNSFAVAPLFQKEIVVPAGCPDANAPYQLPENLFSVLSSSQGQDSLLLVFYEMDESKLESTSNNIQEIAQDISTGNEG